MNVYACFVQVSVVVVVVVVGFEEVVEEAAVVVVEDGWKKALQIKSQVGRNGTYTYMVHEILGLARYHRGGPGPSVSITDGSILS